MSTFIIHDRKAQLFDLVGATRPTGRLTGMLHGRQQQADKHTDDRNHDQQLDESKTASAAGGERDSRRRHWGFVVHGNFSAD